MFNLTSIHDTCYRRWLTWLPSMAMHPVCSLAMTVPIQYLFPRCLPCLSGRRTLNQTSSATMDKCTDLRKYAFQDPCLLDFFLVLLGTTTSQNIRHFFFKPKNVSSYILYTARKRKVTMSLLKERPDIYTWEVHFLTWSSVLVSPDNRLLAVHQLLPPPGDYSLGHGFLSPADLSHFHGDAWSAHHVSTLLDQQVHLANTRTLPHLLVELWSVLDCVRTTSPPLESKQHKFKCSVLQHTSRSFNQWFTASTMWKWHSNLTYVSGWDVDMYSSFTKHNLSW